MNTLTKYLTQVQQEIEKTKFLSEPQNLYEPINYFLGIGGKRIRPVMALMSCDVFDGNLNLALQPAIALELFHNFTLIHDDIMDEAPIRRNQQTIHEKYNTNTAILSGDALLIKSYQFFESLPNDSFKNCVSLFSKTALEVCEGQQYDMDFENLTTVKFEEYIQMITYKTGVLGACAFKLGAIIANTSEKNADLIYQFGLNLGVSFQIMDDYLDVFGNLESVGKRHAGDIYENKKTILYILAKQFANENDLQELNYWYSIKSENIDKVFAVERIFKRLKVDEKVLVLVKEYSNKAFDYLSQVDVSEEKKQPFVELANYLLSRTS